jgi:hypothetical protein
MLPLDRNELLDFPLESFPNSMQIAISTFPIANRANADHIKLLFLSFTPPIRSARSTFTSLDLSHTLIVFNVRSDFQESHPETVFTVTGERTR